MKQNGERYEGYWENGLPHGWGIEILPNGDSYEGKYVWGAKVGLFIKTDR